MQDVFDMVYSLLVFVNIRVILYKTYVLLICAKYNTLTLEFKINIAMRVPLQKFQLPVKNLGGLGDLSLDIWWLQQVHFIVV